MYLDNVKQILFQEGWKYLSYFDLISFGLTSKQNYKLLASEQTWRYLLKRDFEIDESCNFRDLYEYKYLLPDSYLSFDAHDKILRHRLYRFIYSQPYTDITYWCVNKNTENLLVAIIIGYNIYEVILKYIIHIELPQLNTSSLWRYLKIHDNLYYQIEAKSLGDVLNKLIPSFTSFGCRNQALIPAIPIPTF